MLNLSLCMGHSHTPATSPREVIFENEFCAIHTRRRVVLGAEQTQSRAKSCRRRASRTSRSRGERRRRGATRGTRREAERRRGGKGRERRCRLCGLSLKYILLSRVGETRLALPCLPPAPPSLIYPRLCCPSLRQVGIKYSFLGIRPIVKDERTRREESEQMSEKESKRESRNVTKKRRTKGDAINGEERKADRLVTQSD